VTGCVVASADGGSASFVPSTKEDEIHTTYEGRIRQDVLYAGSMAMYRSAIAEIGEFDVRLGAGAKFPGAEDNDFCYRLLESGYRIRYVPEALLYHQAWRADLDTSFDGTGGSRGRPFRCARRVRAATPT
jgi:GT2 family glycosyltransferase